MFFFTGLEFIFPIATLGLVILGVIALAGGRQPDPTGRRPYAMYLAAVTFVSTITLVFASYACVTQLSRLGIASDESSVSPAAPTFEFEEVPDPQDPDDRALSSGVLSGLIALAAGLLLFLHTRWMRDLARATDFYSGEARRTFLVEAYSACFIAVLVGLGAAVAAAYGLFRVIAPGTTAVFDSEVERNEGIIQLITSVYLVAATTLMFLIHWRRAAALMKPAEPPPPSAPEPAVAPRG